MRRSSLAALTLALLAIVPGCTISRTTGPGRPIGYYDYCVVSPQESREYFDTATRMLDQSFVVLHEDDPRLELPSVRQKACMVTVDWTPGFWSSSGWVEVKDYGNGTHVHTSQMRRGMLWIGAGPDVLDALRDVAAARAAGPPLPPDARNPVDTRQPAAIRSKSQRLTELNEMRTQGLISDPEYSKQRAKIIDE